MYTIELDESFCSCATPLSGEATGLALRGKLMPAADQAPATKMPNEIL